MTSTGHLMIHILALNIPIKVHKGERLQHKTIGKYGEIFNSCLASLTHLWTGNYLRLRNSVGQIPTFFKPKMFISKRRGTSAICTIAINTSTDYFNVLIYV